MTASLRAREATYWMSDNSWYVIDEENDCFVLTEAAPERAVKSFELYCEINNIAR